MYLFLAPEGVPQIVDSGLSLLLPPLLLPTMNCLTSLEDFASFAYFLKMLAVFSPPEMAVAAAALAAALEVTLFN